MTADPAGLPARAARATVAVAFCPSPPLLLPVVEGRASPETTELRRACAEAVARMLEHRPAVVVVVGAGIAPGDRVGPGDRGDLRGYGVDLEIAFAGRVRPGAGGCRSRTPSGPGCSTRPASRAPASASGPADLAAVLRDLPGPLGVLAMGDGSARRTAKAPGYLDDAAAPFDAAVAAALAAGDAGALAALDLDEGERLLAAGAPTWQAVGAALAGRDVTAHLHLDAAPFGVGYLAADWTVA